MFVTTDAVSQLVRNKKVDGKILRHTAALAPIYGLCLEGLMETGELVGKYISNHPLAKAALGPNLFGNIFNAVFFANNTIGEKRNYSIRGLIKHYAEVLTPKKDFWKHVKEKYISNIPKTEFMMATLGTFTFWNGFQWWNYATNLEEMRVSAALVAAFAWTTGLSLWSHSGRKKVVGLELEKNPAA